MGIISMFRKIFNISDRFCGRLSLMQSLIKKLYDLCGKIKKKTCIIEKKTYIR
jgi:hypothetical protein